MYTWNNLGNCREIVPSLADNDTTRLFFNDKFTNPYKIGRA
jgi:hypothetical protein